MNNNDKQLWKEEHKRVYKYSDVVGWSTNDNGAIMIACQPLNIRDYLWQDNVSVLPAKIQKSTAIIS